MFTIYTQTDKMTSLMSSEPEALRVISRFRLPLGVADKTVDEVCKANNVHTATFLAIVNYKIGANRHFNTEEISLPTLLDYLRQSHKHFFDFSLPMLRKKLIEATSYSLSDSQIPILIIRYFDEYTNEISIHMEHENSKVFPYVESLMRGAVPETSKMDEFVRQHRAIDDKNIANKLSELKNLIIKYYPDTDCNSLMYSALYDLFLTEQDIMTHCSIEDNMLLPAVRLLEKKNRIESETHSSEPPIVEELSEREKDVLREIVRGLSNKEIAEKLFVSIHTVMSHRKNISRKLNIHSTAGLTIYAIVNNIVDIEAMQN